MGQWPIARNPVIGHYGPLGHEWPNGPHILGLFGYFKGFRTGILVVNDLSHEFFCTFSPNLTILAPFMVLK